MTTLPLRARLLTALAGDPDGTPPWVLELAEGEDAGLFLEDGPAWTVHAGTATMVAGIRALLMQALHPGALAGVHDHSRYREDPLGRLSGTVRWIICVTFGSKEQAERETARVARFHTRVTGDYRAGDGSTSRYSASDADLVEWVHIAFTDSFLTCHEAWGTPIPGGADAYVRDWATAGRLMRLADPPLTATDMHARIDDLLTRGVLRGDIGDEHRVADVVSFLRRPPFEGSMNIAYRLLFASAVATIPARYRRLLGVRRAPFPVVTLTRWVLRITGKALGGGPRAHDFAKERLRRLTADDLGAVEA